MCGYGLHISTASIGSSDPNNWHICYLALCISASWHLLLALALGTWQLCFLAPCNSAIWHLLLALALGTWQLCNLAPGTCHLCYLSCPWHLASTLLGTWQPCYLALAIGICLCHLAALLLELASSAPCHLLVVSQPKPLLLGVSQYHLY